MTCVRILLLGPPRVFSDDRPVQTDTRKAVALLAYLAVTGAASRDRLAELLWPETGQKKARAALRRTLSALSEARSAGWLVVDRENVALDESLVSTDVAEFRSLLGRRRDEASLSAAVELWRGDFMAGFSLRDSAAFDDWQFFEGEEARRQLIGALDSLSGIECANGDWEAATTHARRWLSLDRLNESAHRRLMEIFAWSGRRSAALKQYDECENILADELGVSPLEETILLYRAIRADDPPPKPKEKGSEPAESASEPTPSALFGREVEMEKMLRAYEGEGRIMVLEGEAGIGKTRLAEEFLALIESEGATTLTTHCYESERTLAYGPFIEALSSITANPKLRARLADAPEGSLAEAARIAPGLSGSDDEPPLDAPGARSRFFESVAQVLSAATSGEKDGVVFVDDAHLADASSLELLAYLSRRLPKIGGARLLLARRVEEEGDPLRRFREEARRTGGMVEIPVSRLAPEAVGEMSAFAVGASPETAKRLYEETEGVPLFVEEYLRGISSGVLATEDDAWLPPGGVREVILGRLQDVGQTARQVLAAAAAVGRSFDFDTVREASGRSEEEALEAVEELVSRGIISEIWDTRDATHGGAAYDFSHGQLRAVVYEETSLARKRILHRRIAAALAKRRGDAPARIARHHLLAGDEEEAARRFALAGEQSARLYANAEALSHFEAALSLGHPDAANLREEIGDLHTLAGDYSSALSDYENALPQTDDPSRVERKLGGVYQRLGERKSAKEYYLRAMDSSRTATERATLYADLGLLAHGGGDLEEASRCAEESLRLAGESEEALTLARTHGVVATVARGAGDMERARGHLEKSLAFSGEVEDPSIRIAALNNLALVLGETGETERAAPVAEEALALCQKLGDRHHEAALRNNLADLLHAAGREEESRENQREAVAIFAEIGDGEWRPGIWKLVEW